MFWHVILIILEVLLGIFVALGIVAMIKKPASIYKNAPEQRNPMEGKKVIFIEDENDKENADGVKGHLQEVGKSDIRKGFYENIAKRGLDLILSFGGLVVLSPVYLGLSLAIVIDDPGPVLFTQKRVGKDKQYFKLHKFRSMKMSTPHDVPTHMLENPDQYITKVGKFIRAHSLDELPQIWDIFIGNMSVIGPRPALWNQDYLTSERDKYGANDIKPGLTGWAQINGRDELEIEDKAKLDGEYCKDVSLGTDAKVFLGSLHVFGKDGSVVEGGTGAIEALNGSVEHDFIDAENIKVSVIMPAYNSSQYIQQSIDSVIKQTYQNWELIVVDDCSSDDTKEIIHKYADVDKRIVLVSNDYNLGVAESRNHGTELATGKYIAFLDSDDLWKETKLEKQVSFMQKIGCALSFTSYQKFDSNTEKKGRIIKALPSLKANDVLGNTIIGCLTVMYDSEKTGKMKMPKLNHMEDNVTWYNILAKGFTAYGMDEVLSFYREGNKSLTRSKTKAAMQQWRVYRDYFGFPFYKSVNLFTKYAYHAVAKQIK